MQRFIKAVGAGAKRARALTRDEARQAMALLTDEKTLPAQVGAFLLAMRMKGETADELAGFVDGVGPHLARFASPPDGVVEVDAHGDGHEGVVSLLPAAACAAAALGVPVCLGVELGSPFAKHGLDASLPAVGFVGALDLERAEENLSHAGVCAWDLALGCPPLGRLVALRAALGVRTVAQTVSKLVSPAGARRRLAGVFHAPYLEPTAGALGRLGVERGLVVQALGGLPEARPQKLVRIAWAENARATAIDFREFWAAGKEGIDLNTAAAAANRAALDGEPVRARQAAATAALMVHAATSADPAAAANDAFAVLLSHKARAVASRLT